MSQTIDFHSAGNLLHVKLTGKLTKEAYELFVPAVDEQIKQHGKLRVLVELNDFHGWTAGGVWEDTKFDLKHWRDIEKLALVGESKWEAGMATFCKPFTAAKVQYFDHLKLEDAKKWLAAELVLFIALGDDLYCDQQGKSVGHTAGRAGSGTRRQRQLQ